jgi:hypothetical protein
MTLKNTRLKLAQLQCPIYPRVSDCVRYSEILYVCLVYVSSATRSVIVPSPKHSGTVVGIGFSSMELEETLWRSHLEEAGHSLIAEGAELLLEERFEEALIALDGALELAPSLRPCAVCVPIRH